MRRRKSCQLLGAALATVMLVAGLTCTSVTLPPGAEEAFYVMPVFLIDAEELESPAVGGGNAFKPSFFFAADAEDASGGQSAGFFLTVATGAPDTLRIRLMNQETGAAAEFVPIAAPTAEAQRQLASGPRPFDRGVRDLLKAGRGVYWPASRISTARGAGHRYAVLIPETLLSPFTSLELYNSWGPDGTPLAAARIELVRDFFYFAVLGDSVQWGNGLREEDKMSTLVAGVIEQETQRKVIQQRYAQSGARIAPAEGDSVCEIDCSGEVPTASTSITTQVDLIQHPELIDLVLMDGCITDVDVATITNPETSDEELAEMTRHYCGEKMGVLLRKVRAVAPQARVVVTGFFQLIGPNSDVSALRLWTGLNGFQTDSGDAALLEELTRQSEVFRDVAHDSLRTAVQSVNAASAGEPMVAFADPASTPW